MTEYRRYRRVIAAIDITNEATQVAATAEGIANALDAELHILHVIEPSAPPLGADFVPNLIDSLMTQIRAHAESHVGEIAGRFGVPEERRHLVVGGRPAAAIRQVAESIGADLIVVGSHGRHGLGLLLGSTANGVLHGADCDVLSVRVQPTENG